MVFCPNCGQPGKRLEMCKSCRGFHHVLIERGSATDARVGQRVQDYVLLKKLGEGAMGTTFLAALPSEVEVALKLPKEGTSLEREADMLLRVQHCPHVAHLRDRSPEGAWLALDYIEGQTLERLLTTHTLGDAAVRKALLLELVKLLSEIHKVGVGPPGFQSVEHHPAATGRRGFGCPSWSTSAWPWPSERIGAS
jgi:serine/threonine protein kinase